MSGGGGVSFTGLGTTTIGGGGGVSFPPDGLFEPWLGGWQTVVLKPVEQPIGGTERVSGGGVDIGGRLLLLWWAGVDPPDPPVELGGGGGGSILDAEADGPATPAIATAARNIAAVATAARRRFPGAHALPWRATPPSKSSPPRKLIICLPPRSYHGNSSRSWSSPKLSLARGGNAGGAADR
jgi:hypothetical protein